MNTEDILHLGDLNLTEFIREMARWNVENEIFEQNDLTLTRGPGGYPVTNVAISLSNATDHSTHIDLFNRIRSFYGQRKSGFSIHIRKHMDEPLENICKKENLVMVSDSPGMMTESPFPQKPIPQGIEIRPIKSMAGVVDFAFVATQSYQSLGMPLSIGDMIFASPERLLRPYNYIVVAYEADQPVSAAMIMFSHSIAGIYWVGTIENSRCKGLAEICVSAVTREAFRRGASLVVLQASKFGEPVYKRMGFTEFTRYPWYMWFEK